MKKSYPDLIYVTYEGDGQDACHIVHATAEDAAVTSDDVPCAIYKLQSTGKVLCAARYVPDPPPRKKRG
jgi:hypothetical protein